MLVSPKTFHDFSNRNLMLQSSLRPHSLPFQIDEEYPIVLSPENSQFSHCLMENKALVAHANLWPRQLVDLNGDAVFKIGLIGNVATHENSRGRGFMKKLITLLEAKAILADLQALILWSDLTKFYQNLGFESLSQELHCYFHPRKIRDSHGFQCISNDAINLDLVKQINTLRAPTEYTVHRSYQEFLVLLKIPNSYLFLYQPNGKIEGYFVIGKGFDMQGVIHEWGFVDIEALISGISFATSKLGYEEVILLIPGNIKKKTRKKIEKYSVKTEKVPMALCKILTSNEGVKTALSNTFIWGLDSI